MGTVSYEEKLEIYRKIKEKVSVTYLSKTYGISRKGIYYMVKLVDKHGKEILKSKENSYSLEFREMAIKRVLENKEPAKTVAIDLGLSSDGYLNNWIKKYKENGYNMVGEKKGKPAMLKKPKKNETLEEKNKRLEEKITYLEAELEYIKKLEAVVQERKNRQQKKK